MVYSRRANDGAALVWAEQDRDLAPRFRVLPLRNPTWAERAVGKAGQWLAGQVGKASGVLLANHGAIITAESIGAACYRAVTFERMCRFTLDALQAGRELRPLPPASRGALKAVLNQVTPDAYWDGAVRQLLAREPDVLE